MARKCNVVITLVTMMFFGAIALAGSDNKQEKHAQHEEHGAHDAVHHHSHHIGVFNGFTSDLGDHNEFTLGLDYVYSLPVASPRLGIGAFGEILFAEHKEYLLGVPLVIKPAGNLFFHTAPGIVIVDEGTSEENNHETTHLAKTADEGTEAASSNNHFLFRLGAGYGVDLGNISLTPTVNFDFVDGEEFLVFGISLGKGF